MSEPISASGGPKQRISYAEFQALQEKADALWMEAFEKVKAMGEGAVLVDGWKVLWLHEDPNWFQLGRKKERWMVRRGDMEIHDLIRLSANSNERNEGS